MLENCPSEKRPIKRSMSLGPAKTFVTKQRPRARACLVLTIEAKKVVRIARPASLAIWHRAHSHRWPNRSESTNRKHFASLDLKCRFFASQAGQHRRIFAGTFLRFSCDFRSSEWAFASLAKKKTFSHR